MAVKERKKPSLTAVGAGLKRGAGSQRRWREGVAVVLVDACSACMVLLCACLTWREWVHLGHFGAGMPQLLELRGFFQGVDE
jgi:hypothetical protein